jgi:hypothetical protein
MAQFINQAPLYTPVGHADVIDVTLSPTLTITAAADTLAAPQEVTNFARIPGGVVKLWSIGLFDGDDQNQAMDILFLNATGDIGAENAAFSPADAVAETFVAVVPLVVATHFTDNINSRSAYRGDINIIMKCAEGTSSIWVAAVCRSGTPTYTAAGLKLKLGIERY